MEKLAIKGGKPVRDRKIYYGHQYIDDKDRKAVEDVLCGDYLTCGPKIRELEYKLEQYTGAKHAVAVSNGTAALHCSCMAADIGLGDEVITTPLTFAASANCVLYCRAKPVFADIDPETYNIDPESIQTHITKNTKAVIAVDFTGQATKIREIQEICSRHNLIFIEDAAHSMGTKYCGQKIGSLADMTCFSFHPVKTVTSGEGGAVLTNRDDLFEKLTLLHTHGITHNEALMNKSSSEGTWYYEQLLLGYNYRLTDIQAALLISQMDKLDYFIIRRKEIVKRYNAVFSQMPELIVQREISESDTCRHLYIIRLKLENLNCTRKEFFDAMSYENIQCQIHYIPVYWFPYYAHLGYERGLCPIAEEVYNSILSIPLYPAMTDQDVDDVINAVDKVLQYYSKVR